MNVRLYPTDDLRPTLTSDASKRSYYVHIPAQGFEGDRGDTRQQVYDLIEHLREIERLLTAP